MTDFKLITRKEPACKFCTQAKQDLAERGLSWTEVDIADEPGYPTVPQVFYKGRHIGGATDLREFLKLNPKLRGEYEPLKVKRLSPTAMLPTRGSALAAGLDVYADLGIGESVVVAHGAVEKIGCGIAIEIPAGYYARVAPRSGLGFAGLDVLAGVIDGDYRGEVAVLLTAHAKAKQINHGDRIAQLILERYSPAPVLEVAELSDTNRGAKGYGSTGA